MLIEVEQKFPVSDLGAIERRLAALGLTTRETVEQVDDYFAHPQRDFAQTDEALRLRRVGTLNTMTYKGPKLDAKTKTRREIEIALAAGEEAASAAQRLLEALGFTRVAEVRKRRVHATLRWQEREVEIALDHVEPLGYFVELEMVVGQAEVAAAQACLASLASHLELSNAERRSYLELLLAARSSSASKTDRS